MGKFVSKVTDAVGLTDYKGQKKAAKKAAQQQAKAASEQIQLFREADEKHSERLQPFVDLGLDNVGAYQSLLTPDGQMDYLSSNPLFDAAFDRTSEEMKKSAAASGRLNSGGLINDLFSNYLAMGENYLGQQFNRLDRAIGIGQNSAAGQAAASMNATNAIAGATGNIGDINAASTIQRQNINNQAVQGGMNMLQGGLLGSGLLGGAGVAGGGLAGAGLGAMFLSDERTKENMEPVGVDDNGATVYTYKYRFSDPVYVGFSAQEVAENDPLHAVRGEDGLFRVTEKYAPKRIA